MIADAFTWSTFPDAFRFMADNPGLLLHAAWEQLKLSAVAIAIATAIGFPLGAWLGHVHRGSFLAISVANFGRALPSLVLIAFGVLIFGIGFWNNTAALVVLAVPPILTNTFFAVDGVDPNVVEAARGMGMRGLDTLLRVELPLSLPLVFAGIRIGVVFVIATATIAAIAGGGGLGDVIVDQATYRLSGVVAAALWVSAMALLGAFAVDLLRRVLTPRGLTAE